jgi:hypothetical protein
MGWCRQRPLKDNNNGSCKTSKKLGAIHRTPLRKLQSNSAWRLTFLNLILKAAAAKTSNRKCSAIHQGPLLGSRAAAFEIELDDRQGRLAAFPPVFTCCTVATARTGPVCFHSASSAWAQTQTTPPERGVTH